MVFNRPYLEPFDSPVGQVALAVVGGLFACSFAWLHHIATIREAPRLLAPTIPTPRAYPGEGECPVTAILLGALFGAGLVALAFGLKPPRPSLAATLAELAQPARRCGADPERPARSRGVGTGGVRAVPALRALGLPTAGLRADLALAERSVEAHLAAKATAAVLGLLVPWAAGGHRCGGHRGVAGLVDPHLRQLAAGGVRVLPPRRGGPPAGQAAPAEMRHTLALVLDLAVIALAGGAGIQQALTDATAAPHGWAAGQLRRAVATAQVTRTTPWHHLGELGERTGVVDCASWPPRSPWPAPKAPGSAPRWRRKPRRCAAASSPTPKAPPRPPPNGCRCRSPCSSSAS